MSYELEFIGPNDKPALLALSTPEWLDAAKNVLSEIGYKVHAASNHDDLIANLAEANQKITVCGGGVHLVTKFGERRTGGFEPFGGREGQKSRFVCSADKIELSRHKIISV